MKKWYCYGTIFFTFMLGSFIGFLNENIITLIKGRFILRQGLIYEPLIPVYGIGAIFFYLIYQKIICEQRKKFVNIVFVFIVGFMLGGTIEYMCSYFQEKLFGTISWNYSYLKYNLNGRTSLLHACFWGLLGIIFYYLFLPIIQKFKTLLDKKYIKFLIILFSVFFFVDCTISTLACIREKNRNDNKKPSNFLEEVLDKYYPNDYLDKIYNNARKVKK